MAVVTEGSRRDDRPAGVEVPVHAVSAGDDLGESDERDDEGDERDRCEEAPEGRAAAEEGRADDHQGHGGKEHREVRAGAAGVEADGSAFELHAARGGEFGPGRGRAGRDELQDACGERNELNQHDPDQGEQRDERLREHHRGVGLGDAADSEHSGEQGRGRDDHHLARGHDAAEGQGEVGDEDVDQPFEDMINAGDLGGERGAGSARPLATVPPLSPATSDLRGRDRTCVSCRCERGGHGAGERADRWAGRLGSRFPGKEQTAGPMVAEGEARGAVRVRRGSSPWTRSWRGELRGVAGVIGPRPTGRAPPPS